MESESLYIAIEAGGTKWICAIGRADGSIIEEIEIPTSAPEKTLNSVISVITELSNKHGKFSSVGIGTFGPIDLNPKSETYGCYLNTPKEGWSHFNLLYPLKKAFGDRTQIHLDTDVNTAVYAESSIGLGKNHNNICYITVGTGIGGGVISDGKLLKGRMHFKLGHIPIQESNLEPKPNFSSCPFHNN